MRRTSVPTQSSSHSRSIGSCPGCPSEVDGSPARTRDSAPLNVSRTGHAMRIIPVHQPRQGSQRTNEEVLVLFKLGAVARLEVIF